MEATEFFLTADSAVSVRTLKIEEDGDAFRRRIKPKIRIMGYWLQRAGFPPGHRVAVICVAPGIIELHSFDPMMVNGTGDSSSGRPDCPF
jgi:hypothetical protein